MQQVLGSVNFKTGTELIDYSQMWLNYQIEHHLFPALPMLTYRKIQPEVKVICERNGISYIQESVFKRVGMLLEAFTTQDHKMLVHEGT